MPTKSEDLYGSAPDKSPVALLLIDTINDLEFEGADALLKHALPMAGNIKDLKTRAKKAAVPVIYVNDNFGRWRSDFNTYVHHCLNKKVRGKPIVELLMPQKEDYFVLKPKNSGFYSTTLEVLLKHLETRVLILTGVAANNCILFTAADAFLRDFELIIPSDCVASMTEEENNQALEIMKSVLRANIAPAKNIDFTALLNSKLKSSSK